MKHKPNFNNRLSGQVHIILNHPANLTVLGLQIIHNELKNSVPDLQS